MPSLDLSQTCKCHIFSKGKKAEKENSKATNGGSKANSNLHSSALEPGTGDVLWAPGLIRVSRSMLDPKRASVTAPASKTLSKQCVRCETCKVGLTLQCALASSSKLQCSSHVMQVSIGHAVSTHSVQLWSYGIRVVSKRHGDEQGCICVKFVTLSSLTLPC